MAKDKMTQEIRDALAKSDEFLMVLTSKTSDEGSLDVNIILGCDLSGHMIGVLERALEDIKDAAKQHSKKSRNKAHGDGYQIQSRTTTGGDDSEPTQCIITQRLPK